MSQQRFLEFVTDVIRVDYGPAEFNSQRPGCDSVGTVYVGEQSLDCVLQIVELGERESAGGCYRAGGVV